ncbi:MAG TPA: ABC transporter permease subunit [Candidatus Lumbricidophila sp.]|nr:ABC transporter permease subunit [Candidatus Lumbricidophila sp.]
MKSAATIAPGRGYRWVVGIVLGAVFAVPIFSMIEFTLRDPTGGYSLNHWLALGDSGLASQTGPIWEGLGNSVVMTIVTVAVMLFIVTPTILLVTLRFPKLRRPLEFIALLPVSVPAIALVVGLAPVYLAISRTFGTGVWSLGLAYGVIALPYAYRAIQASVDATDVKTLAEAARTLGASWPNIFLRVLVPNLRQGLMAASLLTTAVVFGEYTYAALLVRQNLQTALVVVGQQDPFTGVAFSLLSLFGAFLLLYFISRVGSAGSAGTTRRSTKRKVRVA